ncbi:MAG: THUMP domain-containing protein [Candidatus Aenigmatarchaeota archaeon]
MYKEWKSLTSQRSSTSLKMYTTVRFAELYLKSDPVRRWMLALLRDNIQRATNESVSSIEGRIIIREYNKNIASILKHTFGVVSFSPCHVVEKNIAAIEKTSVQLMKGVSKKKTFAIDVTRSDKAFPFTSNQAEQKIGERIFNMGYRVNLTKPDKTIHIEIRDNAYIYSEIISGPGGMPLGSAGIVTCKLTTERDLLACCLMMKRGCLVIPRRANKKLLARLKKWYVGREIKKKGNSMADVTSETRLSKLEPSVFAPLVGFSNAEINKMIKKI